MSPCERVEEITRLKVEVATMHNEIEELKKVYTVIHSLATDVAVMTSEMQGMKNDIVDIKANVEDIKEAPANDYTYYKRLIVGIFITAVITAFLAGKFM